MWEQKPIRLLSTNYSRSTNKLDSWERAFIFRLWVSTRRCTPCTRHTDAQDTGRRRRSDLPRPALVDSEPNRLPSSSRVPGPVPDVVTPSPTDSRPSSHRRKCPVRTTYESSVRLARRGRRRSQSSRKLFIDSAGVNEKNDIYKVSENVVSP